MTELVLTTARRVVLPFEDAWIKSFGVKLFSVILESLFSVQLSRMQLASVSRYLTKTSVEEPLRIQAEQLVLRFQSSCHQQKQLVSTDMFRLQPIMYTYIYILTNYNRRTLFDSFSDVWGYRRPFFFCLDFHLNSDLKKQQQQQESDLDNSLCGGACTERGTALV